MEATPLASPPCLTSLLQSGPFSSILPLRNHSPGIKAPTHQQVQLHVAGHRLQRLEQAPDALCG